ncbi:pentatricopeptide repeat-containing protein At2g35030, mitochondrial [Cryptomeria japonica]|uniref:pentatricopeptide repeat-containing protein At2g35030, mitochondrial n=1 Tax=Cryptomeria japonica TaxID=3369 RepID=UPI0027DA43F3|nr:pentatricopeptide repeat-containing protein At2g35030, mitochondrial [Cryptomeria japonica]
MNKKILTHLNTSLVRLSIVHRNIKPWNQNSYFVVSNLGSVTGICLHASTMVSSEFINRNPISSNKLITEYARNGRMDSARHVFDNMTDRDVVTWTAMVTGYVQNGRLDCARQVFDKMPFRNLVSWNAMIAAYANYGKLNDARLLFDNMPDRDVVSWTSMIAGYARNGRMQDARKLFDEMPERNVFSWNVMVTGYAKDGRMDDAQDLFDKMHERNVVSWNAMIAGYFDNGRIDEAVELFDKMPERSDITWATMITGYIENGLEDNALDLFSQMVVAGIKPNKSTFTCAFNACARLGVSDKGMQIHGHIIKIGCASDVRVGNALVTMYGKFNVDDARKAFDMMPERDVISWNTMTASYTKHGRLLHAHGLFDRMPQKDVVSWTVMVAGYCQNGHPEESVKLFSEMIRIGVKPNQATLVSILSACSNLAALEQGKQIHVNTIKTEYNCDVFVGNALVTLYSKCGCIDTAYQVFDEMPERDVISWTAIIAGFAQHGRGQKAIQLFELMRDCGVKPNHVTFVGVLTACSHCCLLDEGWRYFSSMSSSHGITPGMEHYSCMVDLLGRLGLLNEAEDFIREMPMEPDPVVWKALLGGCRIHGNLEVGERVAKHLFMLEPENPAAYVLLSNIYATTGRWNDVNKVRFMMVNRGIQKLAGCSWIEIKNKVHAFTVRDIAHLQIDRIQASLDELTEVGHLPENNFELNHFELEDK